MKLFTVASFAGVLLMPALQAQTLFDRELGIDLGLAADASADGLALGFSFQFAGVNYTRISVCSNGYLWFGATSPSPPDHSPSLDKLSAGGPRLAPMWGDYDPAAPGSGKVYYKAAPGRAVITWAGVYETGTTNPIEFQVQLFDTNHIDIAYGKNPPAGTARSDGYLIGASPGNGTAPSTVDFAAHPFLTGADCFAELVVAGTTVLSRERLNWSPAFPGYAISHVACVLNDMPLPATFVAVGTGCPYETVTIYQAFDGAVGGTPLDLGNETFVFQPNGLGGYYLTRWPGVATDLPFAFASELPAGDDTAHRVALPYEWPHAVGPFTDIVVGANGFVTLGPDAPGPGKSPNVGDLLTGLPRIAAFWADLDPSLGGSVQTMYEPVKGAFAVKWSGVPDRYGKAANDFAVVFEPSGAFRIELSTVGLFGDARALVGYSDGMSATDPGASDLSMLGSKRIELGAHREPLRMMPAAGERPRIGAVFDTRVYNLAPGHLAYLMLGAAIPPLDLGLFGAPGCTAYLGLPADLVVFNVTFGASSTDFPLRIPNAIDLAGQSLMAQAASDDMTANALGWQLSNGGRWTIGL